MTPNILHKIKVCSYQVSHWFSHPYWIYYYLNIINFWPYHCNSCNTPINFYQPYNAYNILQCSLDTYYISYTIKQTIYFFNVKQNFFDVLLSKQCFYSNWNIVLDANKQIISKKCVDYGKIPYIVIPWFDACKCITMSIAPRISGLDWTDTTTSYHCLPNTHEKKAVFWDTVLVLASKRMPQICFFMQNDPHSRS